MKILSNHYSMETAFVINSYPYGFNLRCKKLVWLEINKKSTRMVSVTTNPKKSFEVWNAPKASTYSLFGALYQVDESDNKPEEIGHVHWVGVSVYELSKFQDFLNTYREGLLPEQIKTLEAYIEIHNNRERINSPMKDVL